MLTYSSLLGLRYISAYCGVYIYMYNKVTVAYKYFLAFSHNVTTVLLKQQHPRPPKKTKKKKKKQDMRINKWTNHFKIIPF